MEKPNFNTAEVKASDITALKNAGETRDGKAIIGRVVNHVVGGDRVEMIRLEDGTEVILHNDVVVTKWPVIKVPRTVIEENEDVE